MKYYNCVNIVFGELNYLNKYLESGKSYLLVSTLGSRNRGFLNYFLNFNSNITIDICVDVKSNPDLNELEKIYITYSSKRSYDAVIGLGGGSSIDAAKYLAFRLVNRSSLDDIFYNKGGGSTFQVESSLPIIAIPTTSGTGSEVTQFATIWDFKNKNKLSISGISLFPQLALIDNNLTSSLSGNNFLYPALDALSHAFDSLWNKNSNFLTRIYSLKSIEFVSSGILLFLKKGVCNEARKLTQEGSVLAGLSISQTKTSIAHAISYQFTINYGVPHGLACSFSLLSIISRYKNEIVKNQDEMMLLDSVQSLLSSLKLFDKLFEYIDELYFEDKLDESRSGNFCFESNMIYTEIKNTLIQFLITTRGN